MVALEEVGCLCIAKRRVPCTTNLGSTAMSEVFPLLSAFVGGFQSEEHLFVGFLWRDRVVVHDDLILIKAYLPQMNDDDMYDEFGNYLGPEIGINSEDESDSSSDQR